MVDEIVTRQELIDAKRDARDLGKAVNEKVIVSPRYGDDFKSLPMVAEEFQGAIEAAAAAGAGENGWTDLLVLTQDGSTQRVKNSSFQSQLNSKASTAYVDAQDTSLQSQINQKATAAYLDNALSEQTQTVNTALSQLSTAASKYYSTLAEANQNITYMGVNELVYIGSYDGAEGLYYKASSDATTLTKSAYDPAELAKQDAKEKYLPKENFNNEEYSLVIVDNLGRETWLKANNDGSMPQEVSDEVLANDKRNLLQYEEDTQSSDNIVFIDNIGRIGLGVGESGKIIGETANSDAVASTVSNPDVDLSSWAFYGSSTIGYFQTPFFNELQKQFEGIENQISYGMGGATASQHVMALGLFEPEIMFTDNQITFGTNAVTHTLSEYGALVREVRLVLKNGIVGRLTVDSSFIVETVPSSVTLPLSVPSNFPIQATSLGVRTYPKACAVLNICKNDVTTAAGEAGKNLCLKLSIDAMDFLDERNAYHTIMFGHFVNRGSTGTVEYINEINAKLKALYADRFIDIQAYLMSEQIWTDLSIVKTEADITAIAQQTLPPSLCLSDGIHLIDAVNQQLQKQFISLINTLGWYK